MLLDRAQTLEHERAFVELNRSGVEVASLTYSQLLSKATAVAAQLQELRVNERNVLLLIPHGMHFIVGFYGCLLAGFVAVPHRMPKPSDFERLGSICNSIRIAAVVTVRAHLARTEEFVGKYQPGVPTICVDHLESALAWRLAESKFDTIALVQFTSGTVRSPKGVVLTHGALIRNSEAIRSAFKFSLKNVVVSWLPFTHDMGLIGHVVQPVYSGLLNVFMSPTTFVTTPSMWLQVISRYRAYCSGAPNFAYRFCCDKRMDDDMEGVDLSCWRLAYCGAERIDPDTARSFCARFARLGFSSSSFFPCYGLAESTLFVTGRWGLEIDKSPSNQECVSVGSVRSDHVSVKVVEPRSMTECGDRCIGEIWIKSKSNALGYINDLDATETTFGVCLDGDAGYLRTGDLGYTDSDQLYVVGRMKDLIKVRGISFAAEDAELLIMRAAQEMAVVVSACAVVGVDTELGESTIALIEIEEEFRCAANGRDLSEGVTRKICDSMGLLLCDVLLVNRGDLPRTASGKVKRAECRELYYQVRANREEDYRRVSGTS